MVRKYVRLNRAHLLVLFLLFVLRQDLLVPNVMAADGPPWRVTGRASVDSNGNEANGDSFGGCAISADGRFIAFESAASNLVSDDINNSIDVFVHDRQTRQTTRVSVASDGTEAKGNFQMGSAGVSISADGRFVAFGSSANNLVPEDTKDNIHIFVHDRQTGQTSRASVAGRIGFNIMDEANDNSGNPQISADGRFVAFRSSATNLIPFIGEPNNDFNIFVRDRDLDGNGILDEPRQGFNQTTDIVSVTPSFLYPNDSSILPSISADGRQFAFQSLANNFGPEDRWVPSCPNFTDCFFGGRGWDVYVYDRDVNRSGMFGFAGNTRTDRVSVAFDGTEPNGDSENAKISADGRFVVFWSHATNLVPFDINENPDVFVRDLQTGQTRRVNVDSDGNQANGPSGFNSDISGDGRFVVFSSVASNLVSGDTNNNADIFVHDRQTGRTSRVSVASDGNESKGPTEPLNDLLSLSQPCISANRRVIAFGSSATDLVPGDTNNRTDIFIAEPWSHTLAVTSTSRALIRLSPADNRGDGAGVPPFTRVYDDDTLVTLSAPQLSQGLTFLGWRKDGVVSDRNLKTQIAMDADHTMTAAYGIPGIDVISPNGNEVLSSGAIHKILWNSEGVRGAISIEFSSNGGTDWSTLFANVANDGNQNWRVTGPATNQARIRICGVRDPSICDTSDATFTIR